MKPNSFALIMAGGQGTRFWPWSTAEKPKQFLPVVGNRPLITQTYRRLRRFLPAGSVFVIADRKYLPAVRSCLPGLPARNFIAEPGEAMQGTRAGVESPGHAIAVGPYLATAEFCGTCHNEKDPFGQWVKATHLEWQDSPQGRAGVVCQDCHMPPAAGNSAPESGGADRAGWESTSTSSTSLT